jgi:hypothetical protein
MYPGFRALAPAAALVMVLAAGLCGCGGAAQKPHRSGALARGGGASAVIGGGTPLGTGAPASLRRGELPRVGAWQQVASAGARLGIDLRRVIDPLRGSGARLPRDTRAVGVIMQVRNAGPRTYDSSATGDIRLVASTGTVTPVLATRGVCRTARDDFDRYITAGEDRVGCVVFAVSNGATLDAVWFSPHAHRLGRLTWAP